MRDLGRADLTRHIRAVNRDACAALRTGKTHVDVLDSTQNILIARLL